MAKKINKRQWKKEKTRRNVKEMWEYCHAANEFFWKFVSEIPERYNCDPDFPETYSDYMEALDMYLEDEMPILKMQDSSNLGIFHFLVVEFIKRGINELFDDDDDLIFYSENEDDEHRELITIDELIRRKSLASASIAQ